MMGSDEVVSAYTPDFGKADYSLYKEGYFNEKDSKSHRPLEEELNMLDPRMLQILGYRSRIEQSEMLSQQLGIEKIRRLLKEADLYGDEIVSTIFLREVGAKANIVMRTFNVDKQYYHSHIWAKLPDKRYHADRMDGDNAKIIAIRLERHLKETGRLK